MYRSGRYLLLDPGSFARWNCGMAKMQEDMSHSSRHGSKLKKRESLFWGEEEEEENQFSNYLPLSL
jgi:hypothetical protein